MMIMLHGTVCFTDLDLGSEILILCQMTASIANIILEAAGEVVEIDSRLKSNHHKQINLA
jgi:hypothetical protein